MYQYISLLVQSQILTIVHEIRGDIIVIFESVKVLVTYRGTEDVVHLHHFNYTFACNQ